MDRLVYRTRLWQLRAPEGKLEEPVVRIVKAMVLAYGLTLLNIIPQFILHFVVPPLPPILPIIGGYLAGERYVLSAWESSLVGLLAAVVVGLPLPLAYLLGAWGYMAPLFIGFLAIFGAVYCGFIIGGMAYIGGDSAPAKVPARCHRL